MAARHAAAGAPLTINGVHLNPDGNEALAAVLNEALFGPHAAPGDVEALRTLVREKNELWFQRYRATDGYNVYGGRSRQVYSGADSGRPARWRSLTDEAGPSCRVPVRCQPNGSGDPHGDPSRAGRCRRDGQEGRVSQ
jgi:hypothetical protein